MDTKENTTVRYDTIEVENRLYILNTGHECLAAYVNVVFQQNNHHSIINFLGASVAQWSERWPFTSEVAGPIPSENILNPTAPFVGKELVNTLPKVVGFLRALRFPPTGKLTGWVRINTDRKVKS